MKFPIGAKPLSLLGVLLLLSACVSQPSRLAGSSIGDAAQLASWRANGKIGITGIAQGGSGAFTWLQRMDNSTVQLRGPLGAGALQIDFDGARLKLRASDGAEYDAEAALDEIAVRLGAPIPVPQLRYWLVGVAAPGANDWNGAHDELQQAGWRITYSEWLSQGSLRLPGKLTMMRDQVRIVIVVQHWQLNS